MMKKKTVALLLTLVLVIGATAGATLAYLTASTEKITNTFTVGKIELSLAETTETYKIVPGGKDSKDPKLTVESGSEKCYVYALVDNQVVSGTTVAAVPNINTTNWNVVTTDGTKTLYRYKEVVDASSAAVELPVFTEVSYVSTLTSDQVAALNNKTITIQGYAHQSENTDQNTADTAAKAQFSLT